MKLIGVVRGADRELPLGYKVVGLRCKEISISPKELLAELTRLEVQGKEQAFDRLKRYCSTLQNALVRNPE